ncbi:YggS family pyridoxal phosphate-dependent enzyme [Coxiella endosymbiont of Amblyomma sculptum]|uniref:YggS family pyridoxal phosphate-dependent enzyme n=1 Tax=Coxiella endosymbiont of Amblyomma sculptum TaxID=2487929 RepID=UPI00132EEC17|nr:YggS family pyridoxal phosphate-dependent enzyme [Coxiella endosymbiont of Amblyomma sculptum]QHG92654.1 YggS family pyridoxal phosphate-dependent enzyme [Coxiella endosymbiont of Amblyomma sculptum]
MTVSTNIKNIRKEIRAAERQYGRKPNSIILLAVSKSQATDKLKTAIFEGQTSFGENYVQEALPKMRDLHNYHLEWHFIGSIQSNKTRTIASHFSWVHSVSRLKIAEQLNKYRMSELSPLNICIQVNLSNEKNKSGINLTDLPKFAAEINNFERLRLRGIMAIPAYVGDFSAQKHEFEKIKNTQKQLAKKGIVLDTLSMGMTHDFRAAIAAGSTMLRIGTGVFGLRN